MSRLSLAYIFYQQQLVVDENFQLPCVEHDTSDLIVHTGDHVIARDLLDPSQLPDGCQLVPIRQLLQYWTTQQFEQASRAIQLLEWRRNHKFCSHCGTATEAHATEHAMICPSCGYRQYPRVQPCVITVITRGENEVLLARNARNPRPVYGLIAGFVEVGETLEEAVRRETLEEVGIHVKNIQYLASQPWPFPSNLMLAFKAEYAAGDLTLQEEEIADAAFYRFDSLPEIPLKGSIAHAMIMHVIHGTAVADDTQAWL